MALQPSRLVSAAKRVLLISLVGLLSLSLAAPVEAVEPMTKPVVDLATVENKVDRLQSEAADAAEDWNKARMDLAKVEQKIAALKKRSATQEVEYDNLSRDLGGLVRGLYKTGGIDLDLQAMVASDPSAFLGQLDAINLVGTRQQTTLRQLLAAHTTLTQTNAKLKAERSKAAQIAKRANNQLKKINSKLAEAERLLNSLQEADRKKRAAALAAKRRKQAAKAKNYTAKVSKYSSKRIRSVLRYALGQVGDNYNAGGTGPSSYDCSGLTMMAYRQIGVHLSHYSRDQWSQTRRVSRSNLRPGDLVFFFNGIRHVGMYIGNNRFVHAASYRYGVMVSSLSESYYRARLSGFGRVIG